MCGLGKDGIGRSGWDRGGRVEDCGRGPWNGLGMGDGGGVGRSGGFVDLGTRVGSSLDPLT